jgi:hypothetical protein
MLSRVQRVWGNEPSHSQVNSHVGSWSPKWTPKSSERDCMGQNSFPRRIFYIIGKRLKRRCLKLDSHCPFGHLKQKIWSKEKSGVKLAIWLPTTKSQESTQFPSIQATCNIPLKRSGRRLQLCFRPHCNQRSARQVMCLQSCRSPNYGNFETPIWMWPPWRGVEYIIRGKVVASPKFGLWWVLCVQVARGSF